MFAAGLIAAILGGAALAPAFSDLKIVLFGSLGSAIAGLTAVLLLESRDASRKKDRRWSQRIERTTKDVQRAVPGVDPHIAQAVAQAHEERQLGFIGWTGIVLGGFCMFCFLAMSIWKVIVFFKS